jgi:hypothetical protein
MHPHMGGMCVTVRVHVSARVCMHVQVFIIYVNSKINMKLYIHVCSVQNITSHNKLKPYLEILI